MKSVRCLLMGSAAGLMAVSAAQAADLPVKAAPVEYVKVCSLYGAGFWYVPGTDTCMKLGAWVRVEARINNDGTGAPLATTAAGRLDRTDYSPLTIRLRALSTWDIRTQTEYGTLRSYMDIGVQQTSSAGLAEHSPFRRQHDDRRSRPQLPVQQQQRRQHPRLHPICRLHRGPYAILLRHQLGRRLYSGGPTHLGRTRRRTASLASAIRPSSAVGFRSASTLKIRV